MPRASFGMFRAASALAVAWAFFSGTHAIAACWATATGVNFGAYDPQGVAPADAAGTVTLECDRREPSARISMGTGSAGGFAVRNMTSGSDVLQYNIFTSAARTQIWGDGSAGTGTLDVSPFPNQPVSVTAYGRIPPGQNVRAGTYGDTLIVTVEF